MRPKPPRVPDMNPPSIDSTWGLRAQRRNLSPLPLEARRHCRGGAFARMASMPLPTQDQITEKLRAVIDPELRRSIVELGMVRSIEVKDDGKVEVVVSLTTAGCPIRSHFEDAVAKQVSELEGVTGVAVGF